MYSTYMKKGTAHMQYIQEYTYTYMTSDIYISAYRSDV